MHTEPVPPVRYIPHWIDQAEADEAFAYLIETLKWQQESIKLFGKNIQVPRRIVWMGDPNAIYSYSGVVHYPIPWDPLLSQYRDRLNQWLGTKFNSVLANLYRTGADYMGWHQDNEAALGNNPTIASISLGAERKFSLRHKKTKKNVYFLLQNGSLLLMQDDCQAQWEHCLPKTTRCTLPRINLTFRQVIV